MKMLSSHRPFTVPPFQGSGQVDPHSPGLTPWALLHHPFGVFPWARCSALLRNLSGYLGHKWNGTGAGFWGFNNTITHRFNAFNKVFLLSLLVFFLDF